MLFRIEIEYDLGNLRCFGTYGLVNPFWSFTCNQHVTMNRFASCRPPLYFSLLYSTHILIIRYHITTTQYTLYTLNYNKLYNTMHIILYYYYTTTSKNIQLYLVQYNLIIYFKSNLNSTQYNIITANSNIIHPPRNSYHHHTHYKTIHTTYIYIYNG